MSPKTFKSHNTTAITTTAFKMDFIVPCIGMRFTNQSITPTTTSTINTFISGIESHLHISSKCYEFDATASIQRNAHTGFTEFTLLLFFALRLLLKLNDGTHAFANAFVHSLDGVKWVEGKRWEVTR
jgi:hypothetical protein